MSKCIVILQDVVYNLAKMVPQFCTPAIKTDNQIFPRV